MMNVLALEPWYGGSHQQFLSGLEMRSSHHWQLATLPAVNWRWRMEMGAVALANEVTSMADEGYRPAVYFASSMLNLPAFLSLLKGEWSEIPSIFYFHENQLTYPLPEGRKRARSYWQINMLSALVANRVVFNSAFHRDNFLSSLAEEIEEYDDYLPTDAPAIIREKSKVLHVGFELRETGELPDPPLSRINTTGAPVILRNQRWDYDKNPDAFLELLLRLERRNCDFKLILTGKGVDRVFTRSDKWRSFEERILYRGFVENRLEYLALLDVADIVVSTAIHEFFGIAVMEAISRGCHPLLPESLSYPELIPQALHRPLLHAPVLYEDLDELTVILTAILKGEEPKLPMQTLYEIAARYSWDQLIERYDNFLHEVATTSLYA